ncbi:MAG: hypothetical protein GFH27_549303n37 [Chloroflexi bacterium AL-W]|nr:hypothetical protein [Chloroflexi bacterium AL-N1]NOK67922.1 hypothetical protein [Chloroflexi bacterium AL-N10]NOK73262.1 hypothetical protein [Chloroflexi bacterium AL-N5]NOK83176.1 hypothetical protein [Chloroflexi bacterium AL-W]NOK87593.1 hypothetical protein [Chloroflexi bacterium AL-N15]
MNRFMLLAVTLILGLVISACGGAAPADPAADTGTGADPAVGVDPGTDAGTDPAVGTDTDTDTDAGADTGTDMDTDTGTDAGADTGTDMDTDTDAGADTGTDMDTDTGTDAGADADTDAGTGDAADGEDTIIAVAEADGRFTALLTSLEATGLTDALNGEGPFTVFAPINEAFADLPPEIVEGLEADPLALTDILSYHVVDGSFTADDLAENETLPTIQGEEITIGSEGDVIMLNDTASVIAEEIETSNGVIYVLDSVILPPSLDTAGG